MNNDAIERDEALEETMKTPRPVDPDKTCQISVFVTERVKQTLMPAGAALHMSLGRYAGLLLTKAAAESPLNAPPPEKCAPAALEGADGMTNEEVETLRAENRHLINQLNLSRTGESKLQAQVADLEEAHFREVAELTEKLEMERKAYSVLAASVKSDPDSSIKEKLFFACALLNGIGDTEGRDPDVPSGRFL